MMDERVLERRVREESSEGGIPCAKALGLAEEFGVPPREIGEAADKIGIKVSSCQLGCF